MKTNYELIALDLDGTLLNNSSVLDIRTISYLNKLLENGVCIAIVTGRHYDFSAFLTKELNLSNRYIISNNGASIFDLLNSKLLYSKYLDENIISLLNSIINRFELNPTFYTNCNEVSYDFMAFDLEEYTNYEGRLVRSLDRIKKIKSLDELSCVQSIVVSGQSNRLLELSSYLDSQNLPISHHIIKGISNDGILEIMEKNVNKWNALSKLMLFKNIDKKNVISFGDDINDYEMIKNSGLGFCMKNSKLGLGNDFSNITEFTNDELGVIRELKKLFGE